MSPQQQNLIRKAVDSIRQEHPKLFGVLSATQHARNLSEARRELNYFSPDDFTTDYHLALEHLSQQLKNQGYAPPSETDDYEERIGVTTHQRDHNEFKVPSPQVVNRWYKGHILHEAFGLVAKQNHLGLSKLWDRFPNRREEIEIAVTLAPTQDQNIKPQQTRRPATPIADTNQRIFPILAGTFALAVVLLLAISPPQGGRAFKAIATNFEDTLLSAQGIFDFSKNALKKAEAPNSEPEPEPPQATAVDAPKPVPRPKIALPDRPKLEVASLPDVPRQINIPTARPQLKTPPRVSAPTIDRNVANPSTFFGSRPEVQVARPTLSMPTRGPVTALPSSGLGSEQPTPTAETSDLKGYRPAGRIGFSSFQTSRGLSAELVRLTRIERALSRLKKPVERTFEKAQLALSSDKARIHFADGIAFTISFRFGRLDDIQIFTRSGTNKTLHTETEARRGIRFLDRALSNS